jgi:class 3 adenylate cyclase
MGMASSALAVFGGTVILAARIAAHADGGRDTRVAGCASSARGKGFAFIDRGDQTMRGFEEPVRVFQISWRS